MPAISFLVNNSERKLSGEYFVFNKYICSTISNWANKRHEKFRGKSVSRQFVKYLQESVSFENVDKKVLGGREKAHVWLTVMTTLKNGPHSLQKYLKKNETITVPYSFILPNRYLSGTRLPEVLQNSTVLVIRSMFSRLCQSRIWYSWR